MSPDTETASLPEQRAPAPSRQPAPRKGAGGRRLLRSLSRRPGLVLALVVVAALVVAAFWPEAYTGRDPVRSAPAEMLQPPGAAHWFGTDELGRDLYARVVHGAGVSLRSTLIAVALAFVVGGGLGLVAGFLGGLVESVLMRIVDVLLAVPGLFLSLAVVTALGRGTTPVALAVGVAGVAGFARITRAEVLRVRHTQYVEAARLGGARHPSVLVRHVVPNAAGPVLALAVLDLGTAVLSVSALSFLGYGAPPPAPEWGTVIADGRDYLSDAWWISTITGLVVAAFVLSTHRISRALGGEWEESR